MNSQQELGGRIKKARLRAGYTQIELAKALGCNVRSIYNWENGTFKPQPKIFFDFSVVTRSDIAWLYDGEGRDEHANASGDQLGRPAGYREGPDLPGPND